MGLPSFRNGVYPLTAFASIMKPPEGRQRAVSPELAESVKSETPEPLDTEMRKVVGMTCQVKKIEEGPNMHVSLEDFVIGTQKESYLVMNLKLRKICI